MNSQHFKLSRMLPVEIHHFSEHHIFHGLRRRPALNVEKIRPRADGLVLGVVQAGEVRMGERLLHRAAPPRVELEHTLQEIDCEGVCVGEECGEVLLGDLGELPDEFECLGILEETELVFVG